MRQFIKKFKKNKFLIIIILITLLGSFLRFYDYGNRWGLGYDQARDLLVASFAIHNFQIPLIGPFASAGAFVYGPQWFWILMIIKLIPPYFVITPWIIQSIMYVFMIVVMFLIGKEMENKFLGIISAFMISISTAQLTQSTNLTSPSMVGVFASISLLFLVRYIKYGKKIDAFLLGFFISNSINIHFQAIGLLVLFPISLIFGKKSIQNLLFLLLGGFIPFIPLLIFDLKTNFYESKNILDYYFYGQYKIYNPNRWLTYIGVFWPSLWGKIIGGYNYLGYLIISILSFTIVFSFIKKKISKQILAVVISFLAIFIMLRFYRGERFESYFVFLHPFVLVLTSWSVYKMFKLNKMIGVLLIIFIAIGSLKMNYVEIKNATNSSAIQTNLLKNDIIKKFPKEKFAIYDYRLKTISTSFNLVLFMDYDGKIDDNGMKIGLMVSTTSANFWQHQEIYNKGGIQLVDLTSSSAAEISKEGWAPVNPSAIYNATENWYKRGY